MHHRHIAILSSNLTMFWLFHVLLFDFCKLIASSFLFRLTQSSANCQDFFLLKYFITNIDNLLICFNFLLIYMAFRKKLNVISKTFFSSESKFPWIRKENLHFITSSFFVGFYFQIFISNVLNPLDLLS